MGCQSLKRIMLSTILCILTLPAHATRQFNPRDLFLFAKPLPPNTEAPSDSIQFRTPAANTEANVTIGFNSTETCVGGSLGSRNFNNVCINGSIRANTTYYISETNLAALVVDMGITAANVNCADITDNISLQNKTYSSTTCNTSICIITATPGELILQNGSAC